MTEDLRPLIAAVIEEAEDDYVDMNVLSALLDGPDSPRDLQATARRAAAVLDALLEDDRVVVVDAKDMLTPVAPGVGDRYLAYYAVQGEASVGDFAWVMNRATWERDVARKAAGTTDNR